MGGDHLRRWLDRPVVGSNRRDLGVGPFMHGNCLFTKHRHDNLLARIYACPKQWIHRLCHGLTDKGGGKGPNSDRNHWADGGGRGHVKGLHTSCQHAAPVELRRLHAQT